MIDLSADFRLRDAAVYEEFYDHAHPAPELLQEAVYALPELRAEEIKRRTAHRLPRLLSDQHPAAAAPAAARGSARDAPIAVSSMSGVSGAGRKESVPLLFCECNESVRAYSVPKHRHLSEIGQELDIARGTPGAHHLCAAPDSREPGHLHHDLCVAARRRIAR